MALQGVGEVFEGDIDYKDLPSLEYNEAGTTYDVNGEMLDEDDDMNSDMLDEDDDTEERSEDETEDFDTPHGIREDTGDNHETYVEENLED